MLDMRRIYQGVAVPQMMYACSAWSNAKSTEAAYTTQTLQTLRSLQARAARAIGGAFKATSTVALDVETHLLPVQRQIEKHNAEALCRMLVSKSGRKLVVAEQSPAQRKRPKRYLSPLQNISRWAQEHGGAELNTYEQIPAFVVPPWWQGVQTHIDIAEAACRRNEEMTITDTVSIYTDGSKRAGVVGAAAVAPRLQQTRRMCLGSEAAVTEYAAELQGISLGLSIAQTVTNHSPAQQQIAIWTDSKAAIRALNRPEGKSGAHILAQIVAQVEALRSRGHSLTVRWVPAHQGIEGNELADRAAKEATGWRDDGSVGSRADPPATRHSHQYATKSWHRKQSEQRWLSAWQAESKGRVSFRYTPVPSRVVLRLHKGLSKRESSILVQLRTEKIGLKDFLFWRNVPGIRDPMCPCREGRQTVRHVLLVCRKLHDLRQEIFGQDDERTDLRDILTKRKLANKAIQLIEQAGILGQHRIAEE